MRPLILKDEDAVLAAAQSGDAEAFEQLIAEHRPSLHAHSYRMLGSRHDADDALQEALFRAWRAISGFEGRSSVRSWLYRIATNACLDLIARRRRRVLPGDHGLASIRAERLADAPLNEDVLVEPRLDDQLTPEAGPASPETSYEEREAVELAVIAALHHLPPRQRAVLILRDALGFTAQEVAAVFDSSPAAVNSVLQRARAALELRNPDRTEQATIKVQEPDVARTVERFVDAFMQGDLDQVVALLAEDVRSGRTATDTNQGRRRRARPAPTRGGPRSGPAGRCAIRDRDLPSGHVRHGDRGPRAA